MESVRQRTCIIQGACTDHFITILLIHYVHTFPMLFSSPSTSSTSNSLTHYISMIYSRDSNLESVRQRTCVVQGACTDHFFTILLVHYVHTFPMLFSSPSASIMSNSLTHFISVIYSRDSNLESVRQRTCVIIGACTDHFFTILLIHDVQTFQMLFSSPSTSIMSNSLTHFISMI